jgi:hypothetical protein
MTRLVVRTYTFVCDASHCDQAIVELTGCREENSARAAWSEAAAEGWTTGRGENEHFCPRHGSTPPPQRRLDGLTASNAG